MKELSTIAMLMFALVGCETSTSEGLAPKSESRQSTLDGISELLLFSCTKLLDREGISVFATDNHFKELQDLLFNEDDPKFSNHCRKNGLEILATIRPERAVPLLKRFVEERYTELTVYRATVIPAGMYALGTAIKAGLPPNVENTTITYLFDALTHPKWIEEHAPRWASSADAKSLRTHVALGAIVGIFRTQKKTYLQRLVHELSLNSVTIEILEEKARDSWLEQARIRLTEAKE